MKEVNIFPTISKFHTNVLQFASVNISHKIWFDIQRNIRDTINITKHDIFLQLMEDGDISIH
mgnify:CR=1 FL=1